MPSSPEPLHRTTRAEEAGARRALRGWRTRKLVLILAALPVVAVGLAGYAMAAPGFRHHPPSACSSAWTHPSRSFPSRSYPARTYPRHTYPGHTYPTRTYPTRTSTTAPATGTATDTATATASATVTATGTATASASASATATVTTSASTSPTPSSTCTPSSPTASSASASATNSATATATATPTSTTGTGTGTGATPNPNCSLVVPAAPLTAQGLATPYQLVATDAAMGPCNETNVNQSAFVQATIYDPATGALSVYDPLVVDQGTMPAAPPVVPTLPAGAVVGIWFGFNATNLTLQDSGGSLAAGKCVNGLGNSDFGQFAYCDAPAFFTAVTQGIAAGKVHVPAPGQAADGRTCMTTRDFALIDQDQSDNVTTDYLATADGRTAQDDAANTAALPGASTLANPSDNALLDEFVDPALRCTPWTEPNLGNGGVPTTSLGLDEIQANTFAPNPVALVPLNDPMTLVNGAFSQAKTNLYRAGADQPALPAGTSPRTYCGDMDTIQSTRLQQDVNLLMNQPTPSAGAADNLFDFLAMRLQQSFGNLNCQNFGLTNPVSSLTTDAAGVVTGAVFAHRVAPVTPPQGGTGGTTPTSTPTPRPSGDMHHRSGHHW